MPKKTKREKIIAEYRRKIQLTRASSSTSPSPVHSYTFQPLTANTTMHQTVPMGETTDLTTIRKDLIKTLLLAVAAISVEIGLYWKFR